MTVNEDPQIEVGDCPPVIKVVHHSVRGFVVTVAVSVPSAGKLVVSGKGFASATKRVGKAGTVTVRLTLSKRERRFLAHHRRRRLKAALKVLFLPSSGARLSTHLMVRVR